MRIAVTGATGFLGRHIVQHLIGAGHTCRAWHRPASDLTGFDVPADQLEWVPGELGDVTAAQRLVEGCDAVVHAALYHHGARFRGGEGAVVPFVEKNVVGTLVLIEAARDAAIGRFVFISTCAVHEKILGDRPLDETHPLWPTSHYGAHKAAIEKFIHAYGLGQSYDICALRPTGIYGLAHPPQESRWYDLVRDVAQGKSVECTAGGKEVHAADVARATGLLLTADNIAGESYNCYDRYISQWDVAHLARDVSGSAAEIRGEQRRPKNQIRTDKLRELGMEFGGDARLESTVRELLAAVKA